MLTVWGQILTQCWTPIDMTCLRFTSILLYTKAHKYAYINCTWAYSHIHDTLIKTYTGLAVNKTMKTCSTDNSMYNVLDICECNPQLLWSPDRVRVCSRRSVWTRAICARAGGQEAHVKTHMLSHAMPEEEPHLPMLKLHYPSLVAVAWGNRQQLPEGPSALRDFLFLSLYSFYLFFAPSHHSTFLCQVLAVHGFTESQSSHMSPAACSFLTLTIKYLWKILQETYVCHIWIILQFLVQLIWWFLASMQKGTAGIMHLGILFLNYLFGLKKGVKE